MFKKSILFSGLIFVLLSGCSGQEEQKIPPVEISELEDISVIQFGTTKHHAEDAYKNDYSFSDLVKDLESSVPLEAQKGAVKRGERYVPLCLYNKDGTKDIFYFFSEDDKWYMETEEGLMYQNAEYIQNYVGIHFNAEDKKSSSSYSLIVSPSDLEKILTVEQELPVLDARYDFTSRALGKMNQGFSMEDAVAQVKEDMIENEKLYVYAKEEGMEFAEEELDKYIEKELSYEAFLDPETDKTYQYDSIYEKYGTTFSESMERQRELLKKVFTVRNLYQAKYTEFSNGNDTINGTSYWTVQEYQLAFVNEVVYPEMEKRDFSDYLKEVEEAEAYFREKFSNDLQL